MGPLARLEAAVRSLIYDPTQVIGRNRGFSECLVCGHHGRFWSFGNPPRRNAQCPRCGAKERHRLMALWMRGLPEPLFAGKRVLHVAPDPGERALVKDAAEYTTADLDRTDVDLKLDLTATGLEGGAYDIILCSHVLEHIDDDHAAMREIHRLLAPGGVAILMVPYLAGLAETYEDPTITDLRGRHRHFGQKDHVRLYGRDYVDRLAAAGFEVETFAAASADCVRYGLVPGEPLFAAWKNRQSGD